MFHQLERPNSSPWIEASLEARQWEGLRLSRGNGIKFMNLWNVQFSVLNTALIGINLDVQDKFIHG